MDIKEEELFGGPITGHWYYVAKGRALRSFLGRIRADEVLDVGAGSGIFARQLLDHGLCDSAICIDPNYKEERTEVHNGKRIAFVRSARSVSHKLILMMDVLEHVDDDVGLLKQYMPERGGHVLITVPAFRFLWSGHDVFLEHRRRYTAQTLESAVRRAKLEPVRTRYFFGLVFPAVAVTRLVRNVKKTAARSDLKLYPGWLNGMLIALHDLERQTLFPVNRLAGLTMFCLCKRL